MSSVISDPREIRRFQDALRQFNSEVTAANTRIHSQLNSLGSTWRDQEYQKFSQELETALRAFQNYLQNADGYLSHLNAKAAALESFLD